MPTRPGIAFAFLVLAFGPVIRTTTALAESDRPALPAEHDGPDGVHVIDGSYVLTVGELQVNITNHGLIGSQFTRNLPYSHAPSGQWPAGSGMEYLWSGGLWVGGRVNGEARVSTGQYEREFRPGTDAFSTIYEARDNVVVRPAGAAGGSGLRLPDEGADDDRDGRIDEETLNGRDDDGDGQVDEDFGQIGDQMLVCTMFDNTPLAQEIYPDHVPLNLEVIQTAAAFSTLDFDDFIALNFQITNIGPTDIDEVYLGFLSDCDIGPRERSDIGRDDRTGYFEGMVRSSNRSWARVRVGYMYDAADSPLPGYFGVVGLGRHSFRTYRYFGANRTYETGGMPIDDTERYDAMSGYHVDRDFDSAPPYDYSFLMATGRTEVLRPRDTLTFDVALVVGAGLEGLLENCANADLAFGGAYFDVDGDPETGTRGRETKECFPEIPPDGHPYYERTAVLMQYWCAGGNASFPVITPGDFEEDEDGNWCIWLNLDNCTECSNRSGTLCVDNEHVFWEHWNCWNENLRPGERLGCTGIAGRETRVPWIDTHVPPPAPGIRVWPRDDRVHVYWNDESEHAEDFELELVDFESYRVWRADNWTRPPGTSLATGPGSGLWQLIAEFDVVDEMLIPTGHAEDDTVPLGRNTGLEIAAYRPACLDDPRYEGLAAAMQEIVDHDVEGRLRRLPALRGAFGEPTAGFEGLLRWETYPAVLDTFFMAAERPAAPGVTPKRGEGFYEYVDDAVHNGFLYFYAVTATDRHVVIEDAQVINRGYGIGGSPNANFRPATPASAAQTAAQRQVQGANIYVYPNPATVPALAEFQQREAAPDDPTGVRIAFANLPAAHNRIRIYTAAGDLVTELMHDGTGGYGETTWNLMSSRGQEIVSGIYLYSVESDEPGFATFVGRFTVIR